MRYAFILTVLLLTGTAAAQTGSPAKAIPPVPEEQLTAEEVKQLVTVLASDPKARRKWKREQRKKRRSNN